MVINEHPKSFIRCFGFSSIVKILLLGNPEPDFKEVTPPKMVLSRGFSRDEDQIDVFE